MRQMETGETHSDSDNSEQYVRDPKVSSGTLSVEDVQVSTLDLFEAKN